MSPDKAIEAIKVAMATGNDSVIIDELSRNYFGGFNRGHPAVISAALKAVAEKRIKNAMPKLISMYEWLNSPDGGPGFTGNSLYWDNGRDATAIELSSETVAAIDSISHGAIRKPSGNSRAESVRYLNEVKAWWSSVSSSENGAAPSSKQASPDMAPPSSTSLPTPMPVRPSATVEHPPSVVERRSPVWPWLVGIFTLLAIVAFTLKRRA